MYALLVAPEGGAPAVKVAEAVNWGGLAWSPDGSKVAYSEGTLIHVVDHDARTRNVVYAGPGGPYPGTCFDLKWENPDTLSFTELESASETDLAYPKRITLRLAPPTASR